MSWIYQSLSEEKSFLKILKMSLGTLVMHKISTHYITKKQSKLLKMKYQILKLFTNGSESSNCKILKVLKQYGVKAVAILESSGEFTRKYAEFFTQRLQFHTFSQAECETLRQKYRTSNTYTDF